MSRDRVTDQFQRQLNKVQRQLTSPVVSDQKLRVDGNAFRNPWSFPFPTYTRTAPAFNKHAVPGLHPLSPVGPSIFLEMTGSFHNSSLIQAFNTSRVSRVMCGWNLSLDGSAHGIPVQKFLQQATIYILNSESLNGFDDIKQEFSLWKRSSRMDTQMLTYWILCVAVNNRQRKALTTSIMPS